MTLRRFVRAGRPLPVLLAALVALAAPACRLTGTEDEMKNRFGSALAPKKQGSLAWWKVRTFDGEQIGGFLNNRIALLSHSERSSIEKTGDNSYVLNMSGRSVDIGSAVALTNDGYFLTAAHCDGPEIFTWNADRRLVSRRVRTVWRGNLEAGGPDLALIHARVRPPSCFTLYSGDAPSWRSRVLTGGFGDWAALASNPGGTSGGRVIRCGPWRDGAGGARWREIHHTAALVPGDSGGPVVAENGELLGVSSTISGRLLRLFANDYVQSYESTAICPDAEWIGRLIVDDRARNG